MRTKHKKEPLLKSEYLKAVQSVSAWSYSSEGKKCRTGIQLFDAWKQAKGSQFALSQAEEVKLLKETEKRARFRSKAEKSVPLPAEARAALSAAWKKTYDIGFAVQSLGGYNSTMGGMRCKDAEELLSRWWTRQASQGRSYDLSQDDWTRLAEQARGIFMQRLAGKPKESTYWRKAESRSPLSKWEQAKKDVLS